jgi:hypothetical protein
MLIAFLQIKTVGKALPLNIYSNRHPEVNEESAKTVQTTYSYLWKNFQSRRQKPLDILIPAIFLLTRVLSTVVPVRLLFSS